MEIWRIFLSKLIQQPITETHLARGMEIKSLLEILSRYPFYPIKKLKNIRSNRDLPRDEIRGAAQRYIYGNFVDSIIWSCFSVEFGLIVKLDEVLPEDGKKTIPKPFTLGRIITCASTYSILDDKSTRAVKEIHNLRNTHIHGSNFIAALIHSYQSSFESMKITGVDTTMIKQGLDLLQAGMSDDSLDSLLGGYEPVEIVEAFEAIQSLSTFDWCADEKAIKSVEEEVERIIANFRLCFERGKFQELQTYFQDYLLKQRALKAIINAQIVLVGIGLL